MNTSLTEKLEKIYKLQDEGKDMLVGCRVQELPQYIGNDLIKVELTFSVSNEKKIEMEQELDTVFTELGENNI